MWVAPEIDFAVLVAFNRSGTWNGCDEIVRSLVGKYAQPSRP
ncbi:MAG TPA: hypothetical protein VEB66_16875 [Opitutaceae bacterium]|nr:hypothetical protein [Opitutaceae bacterium]